MSSTTDPLDELYKKHFRVTIFGSARIQPGDPEYEQGGSAHSRRYSSRQC